MKTHELIETRAYSNFTHDLIRVNRSFLKCSTVFFPVFFAKKSSTSRNHYPLGLLNSVKVRKRDELIPRSKHRAIASDAGTNDETVMSLEQIMLSLAQPVCAL